ncbi:hypothetical protein R6Q57_014601 [Mikania cordata]
MLLQPRRAIMNELVIGLAFTPGIMMEKECGWLKENVATWNIMKVPWTESWTRVDLDENDEAPFFNWSNDPRGTKFYDFLREEVCLNFKRMKTAESMRFADGCLSNLVMWAVDSESSEAVINCRDHEYRILDKYDLLRFGEHDIKILAMHQIKTDPVFEVHGKDFTSLATSIVRTKLWARSKVMLTLLTEP